jgi:hypothetical protein
MKSSSRCMTLGGAVLAAGVLIWVTWGILRSSGQHFWSWIGILGVTLTVLGAVALIIGFMMREDQNDKSQAPSSQSLTSGLNSHNVQAGRDAYQAERDILFGERPGENEDASGS